MQSLNKMRQLLPTSATPPTAATCPRLRPPATTATAATPAAPFPSRAASAVLPTAAATSLSASATNCRSHAHRASAQRDRRSSGMALMGRVWKSDESVERPHMKKTVAVDVPSSSTGLLRQLFVNDNIVAPADSQSRKFTLLTITPKQRRALKASYLSLKSTGSWLKLFEQIFRRLETKCPEIRSIFLTTAFVNSLSRERDTPPLVKTEHDHCKCLVVILDELIHSDNMDESCAQLRSYGEKHAQMRESGFTPQMIEQFGEIAVSVIVANVSDGIKYNHEAVKAWRLFLACVTDEMRVGYEKHSKMSVRRNSKAQ
ncbi:hypothetical protein L596_000716 [Steinernema carpocapsae]|uniref:Globin domain-containing protein n=1 Tax=Steinernema carpocapsae TaxID=34508 RepID=A0A4U8UJ95_STECR|nr:hypothetical protein L596_000716 [Steinernema carpocapsae]